MKKKKKNTLNLDNHSFTIYLHNNIDIFQRPYSTINKKQKDDQIWYKKQFKVFISKSDFFKQLIRINFHNKH